ncbi:MAG TPA: hypothetical protein VFT66_14295 [Roseiflexaceae bacterium]|jgi:hypothetical protein|nr:hypothetical protein [Roseiflexaceae bacterium]
MPNIRKLAPEEVQVIEHKNKGIRKQVEEQYNALLKPFEIGDYGEARLDSDDNRLTVRNRLRAAANRRDLEIEFKRVRGDFIRFKLIRQNGGATPNEEHIHEAAAVASSEIAPELAPKRGGKAKKTS